MIGVLGGTFDPIHYGHLSIAQALYQQLKLKEIYFVPCKQPLLGKTARASIAQRLAMLQLAIVGYTDFKIDSRELDRTIPSYTIETLLSLRQQVGEEIPLGLILGSDVLAHLDRWYCWQQLLQYAHWLIVPRLDIPVVIAPAVDCIIQKRHVTDMCLLHQQAAGLIYTANIRPPRISATTIRQAIGEGKSLCEALPAPVLAYIHQHRLYR